MVGGGWGISKWVLGVLPSRMQAVPEPSQGHLVDYPCRARGDPRGPLAIRVSQEVEDDLGVNGVDPRPVCAVLQGEGGGHPLPIRHCARDGHRPRAAQVGGKSDAGSRACRARPPRHRRRCGPSPPGTSSTSWASTTLG